MGDGGAVQFDLDEVLLGILDALTDGLGDLDGFAGADANVSVLVAHCHQGAEAEVTSTFDDLSDSADLDDFFLKVHCA